MSEHGAGGVNERGAPLGASSADGPAVGSELLIFRAGPEHFALPIAGVQAVIEMPTVQPLPGMPTGMVGVCELRGTLLPVYSPARALNVTLDDVTAAIIVRTEVASGARAGRQVAIAVSAAEGVTPYEPTAWSGVGGPTPRVGLVRGVATWEGQLTTLVDMAALVRACVDSTAPAAP